MVTQDAPACERMRFSTEKSANRQHVRRIATRVRAKRGV